MARRRNIRRSQSRPEAGIAPSNGSAAQVPAFGEGKPTALRQADTPLLEAWPPGYERGSFKLVPGGALLSAKGRPPLLIEEGGSVVKLTAPGRRVQKLEDA